MVAARLSACPSSPEDICQMCSTQLSTVSWEDGHMPGQAAREITRAQARCGGGTQDRGEGLRGASGNACQLRQARHTTSPPPTLANCAKLEGSRLGAKGRTQGRARFAGARGRAGRETKRRREARPKHCPPKKPQPGYLARAPIAAESGCGDSVKFLKRKRQVMLGK
jgi:hypothetical protein